MRAKEGDIVRIIGNTSDHEFEIGELVRVTVVYQEGTEKENYDGESVHSMNVWSFDMNEIEER